MNKNVGPGTYNSTSYHAIESKVNSSHHVFGFPLFGYPLRNKDEGYSVCNGITIKDDRFATLKYKRQQARTNRETNNFKHCERELRHENS